MLDRADFLRTLLLLDAASYLATGVVMTLATPALSSMTLIPGSTLRLAGLGLFWIAAVSALVAVRRPPPLVGKNSVQDAIRHDRSVLCKQKIASRRTTRRFEAQPR